jgi:hypothetical protein
MAMFNEEKQPPNSLLEISAVNKALQENKALRDRVSVLETEQYTQGEEISALAEDLRSLRQEIAAAFKQTGFSFAAVSKAPVSRAR